MSEPELPADIALITGAADRLGAEMARALAQADYKVVIHYRNSHDKAEALAEEIVSQGGAAALVEADLNDREQRATLIARAADQFGPLTVLVNNASLFGKDDIATVEPELWDAHFGVHAEAPVFLARDFAAQLPADVQGAIINIVDERVLTPSPVAFSYHLSKTALKAATEMLAQALAPRVRVNAIGPGPILPEAGQSDEDFERFANSNLLGSHAGPEDIVEAMFFLLNARHVTGQFIAVDGGEHLVAAERRGPQTDSD